MARERKTNPSTGKISRRKFIGTYLRSAVVWGFLAWLAHFFRFNLSWAAKGRSTGQRKRSLWVNRRAPKVVVIGFDGVDPDLLERWASQGKLPNVAKLMRVGTYSRLATTNPPQSPVAWSSFATGMNPGKHNIFDFLVRDSETYMPDLATVSLKEGYFLWNLIPIKKPTVISNRKGHSIWKITSTQNIRTTVIQCPVTFPPEEVQGELLSGLGVPDIRGTMGTYSYYATDAGAVGDTEMGGKVIRISIKDNEAQTFIYGPKNRLLKEPKDILVPLNLRIDKGKQKVVIDIQGQRKELGVGQWSDWFTIEFKMNFLVKVYGIGRFYLKQVSPELRLYLSPINFHPEKPAFPISSPADFSKNLAQELGLYKTLGWAIDTWALNEGVLNDETFLEDLYYTMNKRAEITSHMLKNNQSDLFISVFQATDRVQHLFWRFLDRRHPLYDGSAPSKLRHAILNCYQRMDEIVGEILAYTEQDSIVIILSDHGFNSFRKAVNINTWLVENGFMTLKPLGQIRNRTLADLFGHGLFWQNVDWTRTRAYAMGLGGIYVNLRGREEQGIVNIGEEYESVRDDIMDKFHKLRDPETGEAVVRQVYKKENIFTGRYMPLAPDLVVGFNDGYRVSWQTCLGGVPNHVIEENARKWSGDHCSFDPEISPGILLINKRIRLPKRPCIIDIAPTILRILNVEVPQSMDGISLI